MRTIVLALAVFGLLSIAGPARSDSDPACVDADTGRIHIGSSCKYCPACAKEPREILKKVRDDAGDLVRSLHKNIDLDQPPLP